MRISFLVHPHSKENAMGISEFFSKLFGSSGRTKGIDVEEHEDESSRDEFNKQCEDASLQQIQSQFRKESDEFFEISYLMQSLQGWCVAKMLRCKTDRGRAFLQDLHDWADDMEMSFDDDEHGKFQKPLI